MPTGRIEFSLVKNCGVQMGILRWRSCAIVLLGTECLLPGSASLAAQATRAIRGFASAHVETERALEQKFRAIPDATRAQNDLRHLTNEPHMAGTEASHRVAEWLRDQYRSYGFDTEIVAYSAYLGMPREVSLELVTPEKKKLATPEQAYDADTDTSNPNAVGAFNAFSASGDITAPVVYVNYGTQEDYRALAAMGISVEGKIALARYGRCYRGIKTKLAEEHKAHGLIIYSDPEDDGYAQGDMFTKGPWRPMSGIQRGSVEYTEIYPGDPLTSGIAATRGARRITPAEATNLSRIPTMPINAQDAAAILSNLGGAHVPRNWQGGLPFTYHVGAGNTTVHMKVVVDYQQRPIYDVIAKLHGTSDDEWVMLGNHHDAWVYGAVDPGSGTATMLETARALGELTRGGWKPRRTIVMCEWDGEEPGLIGSTEFVEANLAELQTKAVAYINTDVGVAGPNFSGSATPSLKELIRDVAREVPDPSGSRSVYDMWLEHSASSDGQFSGASRLTAKAEGTPEAPVGDLGAGSDFCAFFDHAGIPSMDMGFAGDYGVYHSIYDDFFWMRTFGDPTFAYHATLAKLLGTAALRLDEADVLPFDYPAYSWEISRAANAMTTRAQEAGVASDKLKAVVEASSEFTVAATRASQAVQNARGTLAPALQDRINRELVQIERSLLEPGGLTNRPWYKHTIYAPGNYAGYAPEMMPGLNEALDRMDRPAIDREAEALAAAMGRASTRLDVITRLASGSK
jgi:N-acetylated-alpha-linked acidic dipeptidase